MPRRLRIGYPRAYAVSAALGSYAYIGVAAGLTYVADVGSDLYSGAFGQSIQVLGGNPAYGATLQFDLGDATVQTVTYQWYRADGNSGPVAISGATYPTYTSTIADQGQIVSCIATGSINGAMPAAGVYIE